MVESGRLTASGARPASCGVVEGGLDHRGEGQGQAHEGHGQEPARQGCGCCGSSRCFGWRSLLCEEVWGVTAADPEFIERVKAAKSARRLSSLKYRDRSRLAFIVHSFNRISNIGQIVNGLRAV